MGTRLLHLSPDPRSVVTLRYRNKILFGNSTNISGTRCLSQSKATRKLHEGKYDIRDKKLPVLAVLVNSSNYSRG